jgi:hypothetical protein
VSKKQRETLNNIYRNNTYRRILIFSVPLVILLWLLVMNFVLEGSQQFSLLAQAFLHGHLNFLSPIGGLGQDPILWHGKIYWGEGPFPAILLMPFVSFFSLFHRFYFQGYLGWLLILGVVFFVFKLARYLKYSNEDSLILTLGFSLGSVFIGVASVSSSWFFAQLVTTFLLFWGFYEYYTRKHTRWWLIGLICALILMTRATAAPVFIFFCLELWMLRSKTQQRLKKFIQLSLPMVIAVLLLGLYNFLRFHNPFNGGYTHQLLYTDSAIARSYGEFSLIHIPAGMYTALLRAPIPVLRNSGSWTLKFPYIQNNVYGMSIFITSPYLLSLFSNKWSSFDSRARHLLIAALASALLVFSYFGLGLIQFGYRYSLDFLPELFLLFMIMYRKNHRYLSRGMKILLLVSGVFNFYLLLPLVL